MIKRILIAVMTLLSIQLYGNSEKRLSSNFCELLGMLDEYISRFDYINGTPNDSLVECFYPHEKVLAEHFTELIKKYEKESLTTFHINIIIGPQGHIYFYSKSLSGLINSYYKLDKEKIAFLDKDLILKQDKKAKIAYIKGVYLRFGNGNEISIANGFKKINTIVAVMKSINSNDIKLYKSKDGYIPVDYVLTFSNSEYLNGEIKNENFHSKLETNIYEQIEIK